MYDKVILRGPGAETLGTPGLVLSQKNSTAQEEAKQTKVHLQICYKQ